MTLNRLLTAHILIAIGSGIAFGLYSPLMIALFGVLETQGTSLIYWYVASFARMFGAALFGFGFLLWSIRPFIEGHSMLDVRRRILLALLFSNLMALFVTFTQQVVVWNSLTGWITSGVFLLLALGYLYFLVQERRNNS